MSSSAVMGVVAPGRGIISPHAVTPAKAGVSRGKGARYDREIPAFAGMTDVVGMTGVVEPVASVAIAPTNIIATGMDA